LKQSHTIPKRDTKESRQKAKARREKGLLYLSQKGISVEDHCKKKDPLYKIKGIVRKD
jgi:hypothetical protein